MPNDNTRKHLYEPTLHRGWKTRAPDVTPHIASTCTYARLIPGTTHWAEMNKTTTNSAEKKKERKNESSPPPGAKKTPGTAAAAGAVRAHAIGPVEWGTRQRRKEGCANIKASCFQHKSQPLSPKKSDAVVRKGPNLYRRAGAHNSSCGRNRAITHLVDKYKG